MFRSKQKVLLVKEETEYGSDPTPTVGANAVDAVDIKVNYAGDVVERGLQRASISPVGAKLGKRWIEVTFTCEVKGSGTPGVAPAIGDLLEACGFAESIGSTGGSSSCVYEPASTGIKSVTIYVYDIQTASSGNSRLHKITGARGSVNLVCEAGQVAKLEFKMSGLYNAMTDVTTPGAASYESTSPPIVNSASFTLNSVSDLVAQSVNIDMANDVQPREDVNSSGGIKGFEITARKPAGSFNPEAVLAATYDFLTDWTAATERALSVIIGSAAGNKCTVSAPKVTVDAISEGDRNGIRTEDIPFRCGLNSGDDEVSFTFE